MHIANLSVSLPDRSVLQEINLTLNPGSLQVIMGPNGSGKSTLAYALAGHPHYKIDTGSITLNGLDITTLSPDARAKAGLFIAFQYPVTLPGVRVSTFLKEAHFACTGKLLAMPEFKALMMEAFERLQIDPSFADRNVNEGFSGGEKKRFELLQMLMLNPKVAILDEIDSGLDIDALKIVADGIAYARKQNPTMSILIITHYQRILQYITPDFVHVLCDGKLVASGDATLAQQLEFKGYDGYRQLAR